jgi:hypothetical protein
MRRYADAEVLYRQSINYWEKRANPNDGLSDGRSNLVGSCKRSRTGFVQTRALYFGGYLDNLAAARQNGVEADPALSREAFAIALPPHSHAPYLHNY